MGLGGISELGGEPPTARADLRIAAAGPTTSLAAGLLFGGLAAAVRAAGDPGIAMAALGWLAAMNVLLAAFNLLPGAPLDGGRIVRAFLWRRTGDRVRAARFAAAAAALAGPRVGDVMTPDPDIGGTWMAVADFIDGIALPSAQAGFPVISPGGSLAGVTGVSKLARVPTASRASTTLGQVMAPVPPGYLAAIVISDGRITGIVTVSRLRQIVRREALRAPSTG